MGRPASPFICEGEGAGYTRERERERERKARRKKASGVVSSFISLMWASLVL
jgi:hypothetical protein